MSNTFEPKVDPNDTHHLTPEENAGLGPRDPANQLASTGVEFHCPRCGRDNVMQSAYSRGMCTDCYSIHVNRNTFMARRGDPNWRAEAKEAGIELYERLPNEPLPQYEAFKAYMSLYPRSKPTLAAAARASGISYSVIQQYSIKGHFKERLDEWVKACDHDTLMARRNAMVAMNLEHISIASRLRNKLSRAVDNIDPMTLKPNDIARLLKTSDELERKARIDQIAQEELRAELAKGDENTELKKRTTDTNDIGEVLAVLMKSGALGDAKAIGVRMSEDKRGRKTQELVVQTNSSDSQDAIDADCLEVTDVGQE